jgi:hypothetical protein
MPTLDNHFDDGTGRPKLLSPDKRDDASIIDRNTKIEDMRKRVEKQLAALVAGNDLNALQQQVAELRTTTPSTTPKASFDDTFGFNSSVADGLTMEGKDLLSSHGIPDLPEDTATSTYVDDIDMTDPYGDQGVFTGEVAASTNKPNGLGTMRYVDGRTFSGGWNQGQWHGKGTCRYLFACTYVFDCCVYDQGRSLLAARVAASDVVHLRYCFITTMPSPRFGFSSIPSLHV